MYTTAVSKVPTTQCLTECSTTNGGLAFSLSRLANDLKSSAGGGGVAPANQCGADFMLYVGGFDANGAFNDRFCGNQLNPTPAVAASTITSCEIQQHTRDILITLRLKLFGNRIFFSLSRSLQQNLKTSRFDTSQMVTKTETRATVDFVSIFSSSKLGPYSGRLLTNCTLQKAQLFILQKPPVIELFIFNL